MSIKFSFLFLLLPSSSYLGYMPQVDSTSWRVNILRVKQFQDEVSGSPVLHHALIMCSKINTWYQHWVPGSRCWWLIVQDQSWAGGSIPTMLCVLMCGRTGMAMNLGGHNIWAGHTTRVISMVLELSRCLHFKGSRFMFRMGVTWTWTASTILGRWWVNLTKQRCSV